MKFGQILVCCMTNILNMFWFYGISKITKQQDLAILAYIPFLIVICSPFQKNETMES